MIKIMRNTAAPCVDELLKMSSDARGRTMSNGIHFDDWSAGRVAGMGTMAPTHGSVQWTTQLEPRKNRIRSGLHSSTTVLGEGRALAPKEEIHQIIARRHGFDPKLEDAFEDWDTIENSQRVDKIFDAMDYFLGVVGFVTLALGAIGIVNIMLVSVAERTREIGLRKALGATYQNILTQFFIEGAFLTMFSGGIGLLISTAFVTALAQLPAPQGFDTPRIVPTSAVAAILSLAIAGIVAGIYPARKAALLAPVEAMRQE
jgi:putative ABC transport system permease protein